jgi:hypothetical protein
MNDRLSSCGGHISVWHNSARRLLDARPVRWRAKRRTAAAILFLTGLLFSGPLLTGCDGSRSRRLSRGEALNYKKTLLRDNPGALGEDQWESFGSHSASTPREIDAVFEDFGRAHRERQAAERTQFLELRSANGADSEQIGTPEGN